MNILPRFLPAVWRQHKKFILCCILLGAITLPGLTMLFDSGNGISNSEKRQLSSFPNWPSDLEEYKNYAPKISMYFRDHFGFRDRLQYFYFRMKVLILGVSSTPKVMVGKSGWFFYTEQNVIEHTRNLDPYKKEELDGLAHTLQWRKDWLSSLQTKYIWMIAPNKHTIYPEYLPDHITKVGENSRLEQLIDYFSKHTTVPIVDFRNVLIDQKNIFPTYDKTDSHWNLFGGYIAYKHLTEPLYKWMPDIETVNISHNDFYVKPGKTQDLARLMGIYDNRTMTTVSTKEEYPKCGKDHKVWNDPLWETYGNHQPFYYTCDKKKYTALIFHDSFFESLFPYIGDTFNKTILVRARPNLLMFKWFVNKYKPDIVIEEAGERGSPLNADDFWIIKEESNQVDFTESDRNKRQRIYTNEGTPPMCSIGRINYVPIALGQSKTTSNRNVPLRLFGWAINHMQKEPPDKVQFDLLSIGGKKNYQSSDLSLNSERSDVADYFGNDNYANSGFSAELNVRDVLPGKYKLHIRIPHKDGFLVCNTYKTISIIENDNASQSVVLDDTYKEEYLNNLYRLPDSETCNIDTINKAKVSRLSIIDSRIDEELVINGWALDYKRFSQPVNDLIMRLTNTDSDEVLLYKTNVRLDRHDVSSQFEVPDHLTSGFIFNVNTELIPGGDYSVSFILPRYEFKTICATKYRIRINH